MFSCVIITHRRLTNRGKNFSRKKKSVFRHTQFPMPLITPEKGFRASQKQKRMGRTFFKTPVAKKGVEKFRPKWEKKFPQYISRGPI